MEKKTQPESKRNTLCEMICTTNFTDEEIAAMIVKAKEILACRKD